MLFEQRYTLIPMNVLPSQVNQLTGPAKRPVERQQEPTKGRAVAMAIASVCRPKELLKLVVGEIVIALQRLRLTNSTELVRRDQLVLDSPVEAPFHRSQHDCAGGSVERRLEPSSEGRNIGGPHRMRRPCRKHVDKLLTAVL